MGAIVVYIVMGVGWTIVMTFGSAVVGIVLGLPVMALSQGRSTLVRGIYQAIVHVIRGIPTIVWLFIAFFGLGQLGLTLSPIAASLVVLSIIATAQMAETYRGGMKAIPAGQWEAAGALNFDGLSTFRFVVAPQLFRAVSPSVATQVIGLLKDSALVSTLGVADLVFRAGVMTQYHAHGLYMFGLAGIVYLLLSLPIAAFSRSIHARITRRYAVA